MIKLCIVIKVSLIDPYFIIFNLINLGRKRYYFYTNKNLCYRFFIFYNKISLIHRKTG